MKVEWTRVVNEESGHAIEISAPGGSSWGGDQRSIRNRYPTRDGGFSPRSSSEFPTCDLEHLVVAAADNGIVEPDAAVAMISALAQMLARSGGH